MYKAFSFILCILSVVYVGAGPVTITKCAAEDSKCIKQSAQALLPRFADGVPEYNIRKLDPLVITDVVDASSPSLKLKVEGFVVMGLKDCIVKKMERDVKNSKLITNLLCTVHGNGQYEMDGHLLILAIQGKGNAVVRLNKIQIEVTSDLGERTGRDGKKHWQIKGFKYTYDLKDKAYLKFENLFNGNAVLARAAEDIIANNANEVVMEIGNPIIKTIVEKIVEEVNHFFRAVPADDLSLD